MGSSFLKVNAFFKQSIRSGHLDHGSKEAAFAVFALEFTSISCERNGRIATAQVFVTDHAG